MKKQILSAAILTFICSAALAEGGIVIPFNVLDTDSDGTLSTSEVNTLPDIAAQWTALDKNDDGKLSRDEYSGYKAPVTAAAAG